MKHVLIMCLIFVIVGAFLIGGGCNASPKPEVPASVYGKIVNQLPDIPEAKQRYSYPDYVELRHIPK